MIYSLVNNDSFQDLLKEIDNVMYELEEYEPRDVMPDYDIPYSLDGAAVLKGLEAEKYEEVRIAKYLTVKTGEPWEIRTVRGYCQSDWAIVIYNADQYSEKEADIYGDYCFGCFKEFEIIDPDGQEVYGYYVTDSELEKYDDQEYKRIVCSMEGIDPEDATLEMIDDVKTIRQPVYRIA